MQINIPNTDAVKTTMDNMIERRAEFHVPGAIRRHALDDPRCYMLATYATFGKIGGFPPVANTGLPLALGMNGVIVTLENRLVFCWQQNVFPVVEDMLFWGWIGLDLRVAWGQRRGILRDSLGQRALPHDAKADAVESWDNMEKLWNDQFRLITPPKTPTKLYR